MVPESLDSPAGLDRNQGAKGKKHGMESDSAGSRAYGH